MMRIAHRVKVTYLVFDMTDSILGRLSLKPAYAVIQYSKTCLKLPPLAFLLMY